MNDSVYQRLSAPFRIIVEVTTRCPNSCVHCFNHWRRDNCAQEYFGCQDLPWPAAEIILQKAIAAGVFELVVTGGEPLLNFPVTARLVDKAKAAGMHVVMNSELHPMTEEQADWIAKSGVSLVVSLLGPNSEIHDRITTIPGSFARTLKGLQSLSKRGTAPELHMVVTQVNKAFVKETGALAAQLGASRFSTTPALQPASCSDFSEYQLSHEDVVRCLNDALFVRDQYLIAVDCRNALPLCSLENVVDIEAFSNFTCTCGLTRIVIGCDGSARGCALLKEADGNILRESLSDIWQKMAYWRTDEMLPSICKECPLRDRCGGGCRYLAQANRCGDGCRDPRMNEEGIERVATYFKDRSALQRPKLKKRFTVEKFESRPEPFGSVIRIQGSGRKLLLGAEATTFVGQLTQQREYNTDEIERAVRRETLEEFAKRGLFSPV